MARILDLGGLVNVYVAGCMDEEPITRYGDRKMMQREIEEG